MKKKLFESCKRIYLAFDDVDQGEAMNPVTGRELLSKRCKSPGGVGEIRSFGICFSEFEKKWEKMADKLPDGSEEIEEEAFSAFSDLYCVAFAFGYVMGQMFDTPFAQIQKDVETIKAVIRDKGLLPYLPREKKGGSHEQEISTSNGINFG